MPITSVTENFAEQATQQAAVAASQAEGTLLEGQRQWALPVLNGYSGSPYDIPTIGQAYNRSDANYEYALAAQTSGQADGNGGRLADRLAAKYQVDALASQERAYRARHASAVRCSLLAAARRRGQGQATGVYQAAVDYCADLIAEGYAQPSLPSP